MRFSADKRCHGSPDMFCKFYFGKNNEIAVNSSNAEAREKISMDLES